jgi:hypothetical protein
MNNQIHDDGYLVPPHGLANVRETPLMTAYPSTDIPRHHNLAQCQSVSPNTTCSHQNILCAITLGLSGPKLQSASDQHGPRSCWTLDFGLWTLDLGPWTLDFGPWTLDFGLWTSFPSGPARSRQVQPKFFPRIDHGLQNLEPHPAPQPSTPNSQLSSGVCFA